MPLLDGEKHKRLHGLGPKDVRWEEKPISMIGITKSVSEGEQWSVNVPVYQSDSRDDLRDRAWMFATLLQDRLDEFAEAWQQAAVRAQQVQDDHGNVTKLKK